MTKLVATRVSDEEYSKIMAKCAGLGCSVYDYLKMVLETDINEPKEVKRTEEQEDSASDSEIDERIRRIRERLEAIPSRESENS